MLVSRQPERHTALSPPCTLISEQLSRPHPWGSCSRLLCVFGNFQDVQLNFSELLLVCVLTVDVLKPSSRATSTKICVFIYIRVGEDFNVEMGFFVLALDH